MWKEYSQPWSALPRADHGRGVIFIAELAVVVVVVDMLRAVVAAGLPKAPARLLRKVLENIKTAARSATKAAKVFEVKNELVVAVGCCSLVSVIKRGELCNLEDEGAFYTNKSDVGLVLGSWRGFDVVVALRQHLQWCVIRYEDLVQGREV